MAERVYFSGRTLEQAIRSAARHHQLDPEELDFQQIEKRHGFVKQPRGVVIRVDPVQPRLDASTSQGPSEPSEVTAKPPRRDPAPSEPREEVPEVQTQALAEAEEMVRSPRPRRAELESARDERPAPAREQRSESVASPQTENGSVATEDAIEDAAVRWLDALLDLGSLDLDFELEFGEEGLEIDLEGPDEDVVLDEDGELLRAFQHLLPRLIQNDVGELVHCRVDCDDFQAKREKRLRDLARRTADEVVEAGRPKTLRPMHPADRRIVHLELADDPDVFTESVGTGYFKRVMVRS